MFLHIDGDTITGLMDSIVDDFILQKTYIINKTNLNYVKETTKPAKVENGNQYWYDHINEKISMWIPADGNMYPFIKDIDDFLMNHEHPSCAINAEYGSDYEQEQILYSLKLDQIQSMFINTIPDSYYTLEEETVMFKPEQFEIFRMIRDRTQLFLIRFKFSKEQAKIFQRRNYLELILPAINQLENNFFPETLYNMTGDMRQVVIATEPQYSVNPTYRGRQSYQISNLRYLLARLQEEFYGKTIDIELTNTFNVKPLATLRVDMGKPVEEMMLYTQATKTFPKYATLRYPIEMLTIANIYESSPETYMTPLKEDDFESNVIYANAAAAYIGAGILGGIGQGITSYYEMKQRKELQDDRIAWMAKEQQANFGQQSLMQQSMFNQQKDLQGRNFVQDKYMQARGFDQQNAYQHAAFQQQNAYQSVQNQFTKELVDTNTDSDIRRARNAQQLAGYRTDATVSGLSMGSGRGGLGHPDAPVGVSLPPRSASTQTNSPRVYTTSPSGFYTGPLSSQ